MSEIELAGNQNARKKCPLCETWVDKDTVKCKTCGSVFIDGGDSVQMTGLSHGELSARVNALRKKIGLLTLPIFLCVIAFIYFSYFSPLTILAIVPILAGIILFTFRFMRKEVLSKLIKACVVNDILAETFEVESYLPGGCFSFAQVKEADLISGCNHCSGSDLVKGKYKGIPVAFSDIEFTSPKFKGQWVEVVLKKQLGSAVFLAERIGEITVGGSKKLQEVKTENDAFNKKYRILAEDPAMAFYVLTPHFMEYITAADSEADSVTYFSFKGNRVSIAMGSKDNKRDLFEFGKQKTPSSLYKFNPFLFVLDSFFGSGKLPRNMNLDMIRSKIKSDLKYITGTLDELLKNEYLFGRG